MQNSLPMAHDVDGACPRANWKHPMQGTPHTLWTHKDRMNGAVL
jgi:hypothetical protein